VPEGSGVDRGHKSDRRSKRSSSRVLEHEIRWAERISKRAWGVADGWGDGRSAVSGSMRARPARSPQAQRPDPERTIGSTSCTECGGCRACIKLGGARPISRGKVPQQAPRPMEHDFPPPDRRPRDTARGGAYAPEGRRRSAGRQQPMDRLRRLLVERGSHRHSQSSMLCNSQRWAERNAIMVSEQPYTAESCRRWAPHRPAPGISIGGGTPPRVRIGSGRAQAEQATWASAGLSNREWRVSLGTSPPGR